MAVSPPKDRGLGLLGSGTGSSSSHPTIAALSDHDDRLGMKIGKYVVMRRLGRGGMGIVYEAQDSILRRKVAIKFFSEEVAVTDDAVRRFLLEAQAAARLNHPNVVSVYEVGQHEGIYFLVMELVRGTSAEEHLKLNGPFDWVQATRVTASACRALSAAHAAQLIHRDIKPANLLLGSDPLSGDSSQGWHVKLGDFGLAKLVDSASMATAADRVLGTPNYMSPEQCRSEALDPRSDLYSLGATYYSLLTGKPPFGREQSVQVMFAHCWSPIPDPRQTNPAIPDACAQIVKRAMAKDTHDRYRSAQEMLVQLGAALLEAPPAASADLRFKTVQRQADTGRGAEPVAERDGPPFSRPMEPGGDYRAGEARPASTTLTYPVVGAPSRRNRRPRLIAWSLLVAAVATAGGVIGWGRLHRPTAAALGAPATSPANVPARPASLTHFRWSNDAGGVPASVVFSPDGRRVIAGVLNGDGGIHAWDADSGHDDATAFHGYPVLGVAFPPDSNGSEVFAAKGNDILQWSFAQETAHNLPVHVNGDIASIGWGGSPTGKRVLAVQIKIHPPDTQADLKVFNDKFKEIEFDTTRFPELLSFCFLGNKSLMATGSTDAIIRLWTINALDSSGYPLLSTIRNDVPVYSLASSADGAVIAAGGSVSAQFFLIKNRGFMPEPAKLISKVFRPNHNCRSLALSPDGMTAAIGSGADAAGDVTLYDVNAGAMIAELTSFGGAVNSLAFSPDGSLLATGCTDHTVKTWDLQKLLPDRAAPAPTTRPAPGRP